MIKKCNTCISLFVIYKLELHLNNDVFVKEKKKETNKNIGKQIIPLLGMRLHIGLKDFFSIPNNEISTINSNKMLLTDKIFPLIHENFDVLK